MVFLEVCVDTLEGFDAAIRGGAQRIELCSRLDLGGLSPTDELFDAACARAQLPVFAMVRPRGGDFTYDEAELAVMRTEIEARRTRAHGFVFGVLTRTGRVDRELTRKLVLAARPRPVTFHRAFDEAVDLDEALETLIELGIERVLTSGGAPNAFEGRAHLGELVRRAAGRITILAGGGVRAHNAVELVRASGVVELHGSVPFDARRL
ncbi:MAG: copper homeostasis protein CutC [Planctomycetes bacterium]|nr:copper homeostasis protein CutC [Planctomycetota bacterium]